MSSVYEVIAIHWNCLTLDFICPTSVISKTFNGHGNISIKGHRVRLAIIQCFQALQKKKNTKGSKLHRFKEFVP